MINRDSNQVMLHPFKVVCLKSVGEYEILPVIIPSPSGI